MKLSNMHAGHCPATAMNQALKLVKLVCLHTCLDSRTLIFAVECLERVMPPGWRVKSVEAETGIVEFGTNKKTLRQALKRVLDEGQHMETPRSLAEPWVGSGPWEGLCPVVEKFHEPLLKGRGAVMSFQTKPAETAEDEVLEEVPDEECRKQDLQDDMYQDAETAEERDRKATRRAELEADEALDDMYQADGEFGTTSW